LYSHLKQTELPFLEKEQEGKTGPIWGLVPVGEGEYREKVKEDKCSGNIIHIIYVNGKMKHVETIPEMGERDKGE
jgi:hypothetical protein